MKKDAQKGVRRGEGCLRDIKLCAKYPNTGATNLCDSVFSMYEYMERRMRFAVRKETSKSVKRGKPYFHMANIYILHISNKNRTINRPMVPKPHNPISMSRVSGKVRALLRKEGIWVIPG